MFASVRYYQTNPVVFISSNARWYSTSMDVLRIEGEQNKYKLLVPLPAKGKRVFSLPHGQIRSLIDDMKIDDSTIKDVDILDANNLRLARSMNISHLVEKDWKLRINDVTYYVQAPHQGAQGFANQIVTERNLKRYKDWFALVSEKQDILDYQTFVHKCQDLGLNEQQAKEIIRELSKLGIIFHYKNNVELEQKIFLNTSQLAKVIETALNLEIVNLPPTEQKDLLEKLKQKFAQLDTEKNEIYHRSEKSVKLIAWSVFAGLCAQWLLFARLTWWEYSWDVIEPVTYFTTVVETVLAGYLYYLLKKQEYTNTDMKHMLVNARFRRFARKANFDVTKYEELKKKISFLEPRINTKV